MGGGGGGGRGCFSRRGEKLCTYLRRNLDTGWTEDTHPTQKKKMMRYTQASQEEEEGWEWYPPPPQEPKGKEVRGYPVYAWPCMFFLFFFFFLFNFSSSPKGAHKSNNSCRESQTQHKVAAEEILL
jgi:hypothetical protein